MMLLVLAIASGVLAWARMAAWWVIVPPSVMLLGYLLLLRAAAKADVERREMAAYRTARAAAEAARAAERRSVPVGSVANVAPAAHVSAAGAPPAAKIIASLPTPEPPQEQIYDQYADAKLRAVGD